MIRNDRSINSKSQNRKKYLSFKWYKTCFVKICMLGNIWIKGRLIRIKTGICVDTALYLLGNMILLNKNKDSKKVYISLKQLNQLFPEKYLYICHFYDYIIIIFRSRILKNCYCDQEFCCYDKTITVYQYSMRN